MRRVVQGVKTIDAGLDGAAVTLGAFDGVHRGHQALIERAVALAHAEGRSAVGFTFHPHPARTLIPHRAPALLMGIEDRAETMLSFGLDHVLIEPFDEAFAEVTADQFIEDYLVAPLRPRHVVVGFNFQYGQGRGGDPQHLQAAGARHGFEVHVVQPVRFTLDGSDRSPVVSSSTRIREYLKAGDLEAAKLLLGRRFSLAGRVVTGDRRGRQIGFPTANVAVEAELLPAAGVYATRTWDLDDASPVKHRSVTNIGVRPTFDGRHTTVETHILDFDGDLYGRRLRVELVAYIRPELKFDGIDAIRTQLALDVEAARVSLRELES